MVIDTLELKIIVDNKGTTARINSTTKALKDLHKVISDINGAGGVNGTINGGGGGSSSSGGSSRSSGARGATSLANNLKKSLNFGSMVAKLYFVRNITKQLGQDLAKVVQYGIDYQETLNLWQVAMEGNTAEARKFVREIEKAYGISEAVTMQYQATFKNMLSALGNINQEVAYGLSETLTQMALDYASLYNVSIESAMTKFQAVLAGQVRPIRNESGYDVTEQTLYQLYQDIGGTKTVRQLNQVEKRLLRILAVYRQMQDTAKGDLYKTIRSTANQLRVMQQQSRQFATWMGVAFNQLLQNSGILIEINAYLYAAAALAKQFAISLGYVEKDYSPEQPIQEMNTELDNANKSVDDLKGKLLGFDKFQVLSSASADEDSVDIAKELQKAMDEYDAIINSAENPAFQRSIEILEALGGKLVDAKNEAGEVVGQIWQFPPALTEAVKLIGSLASAFAILGLIALEKKLWAVVKGITGVGSAMTLLRVGGLGLLIYGLSNLITKWDELGVGMKIVYGAATILGAYMIVLSSTTIKKNLIAALLSAQIYLKSLAIRFGEVRLAASLAATAGLALFITNIALIIGSWDKMTGFEKVVSIFGAIGAAALAAAAGIAAFHNAWSIGTASVAIVGGLLAIGGAIAGFSAQMRDIEAHANGGLATKGSLFYAGEAGPELVTQTSGGGSTIMNMKQLEDAVARGFIRGFASTERYEDNDTTEIYVDGQRMFNVFRGVAKRNGYDLVKI